MGTRLKSQRRGKGSSTFRAKKRGHASHYPTPNSEKEKGQVVEFSKEAGRNGLLAKILMGSDLYYVIAAEGMFIGQEVEVGEKADLKIGNIMPLSSIPEGCPVFNIELKPGDGGKLVRSTGSYSLLSSKGGKTVTVKMPSGKPKALLLACRATIGNAACGERTDKPFVKAGNKYFYMKAKSRPWPIAFRFAGRLIPNSKNRGQR